MYKNINITFILIFLVLSCFTQVLIAKEMELQNKQMNTLIAEQIVQTQTLRDIRSINQNLEDAAYCQTFPKDSDCN